MIRKNRIIFTTSIYLCLLCICLSFCWAKEISYDKGNRRDPFVPLKGDEDVNGGSRSSGLNLEGIIYDPPNNSVAVISGQTYKAGDAVGDGKVIEIFKDHVILETNAEQKTIWIRTDEKLQ